MIKNVFLSVFISVAGVMFSQEILEKSYPSEELGNKRKFRVYLPKDYKKDSIYKYPVAFILDDDYLFDIYVGNAKLYADADLAPRQVVVGVQTSQREKGDVSLRENSEKLTNNGIHFYKFIAKELLPHIQENYDVSTFRTIVGEGKAANFLTFFTREEKLIFSSYVCLKPVLTDLGIERIKSYTLKRLDEEDKVYFLYISSNDKMSESINHSIQNLKEYIKSASEKLHTKFDFFKDANDRLSSISAGVARAIGSTFKFYPRISKEEYETKVKDLEPLDAIKYVEQRYIEAEYIYDMNINVRLEDIYAIENIVIDKSNGDFLRVLGDFTLIKYPDSHLGDYYNGLYHEKGRDYERALFYYKEAYGAIDDTSPNKDKFYENIKRVDGLIISSGGSTNDEEDFMKPNKDNQFYDYNNQYINDEENKNEDDENKEKNTEPKENEKDVK